MKRAPSTDRGTYQASAPGRPDAASLGPMSAHEACNGTLRARQGSRRRRQKWALGALTAAVLAAHFLVTYGIAQEMHRLGPGAPEIKRMQAAYVTELKLSTPPVASATPLPFAAPAAGTRKPHSAAPPPEPEPAASAPETEEVASAPQEAASEVAVASADTQQSPPDTAAETASEPSSKAASEAASEAASSPAEAAPGPVAEAPSVPQGPRFVWPRATRVSYKLEGNFRGPIYGQASVEWVRQDTRYQVHVDASVGPSFAPLGSWRLTSEGEIKPEGLHPQRYEDINRLLIKTSAPRSVLLEENEVILPSGQHIPRVPGMQDAASQFIQLAYRFIMNPNLLKVGNTIEMPLALVKKAETLAYDVMNEEVLRTPLGDVPTYHVKPRRMVAEGGALPAEIWFAPGLQYLPVRILVRMNDQTFMDMQMDRAPQQAPGTTGDPS